MDQLKETSNINESDQNAPDMQNGVFIDAQNDNMAPSAKPTMQTQGKPRTLKRKKQGFRNSNNSTERSVIQSLKVSDAGRVVASIKQTQIDANDELESYKKLVKKRKKRVIVRAIAVALLLIIAPIMIFFSTIIIDKNGRHNFFGLTFYIVISNSMEPEILVNDCVILKKVKSATSLKAGDDIGYINQQGNVVVHRIIDIVHKDDGTIQFVTQGINNSSSDQMYVVFENIVGIRTKTLHTLGNILVFFRSVGGIILFVSIFVLIIVAFFIAFKFTEDIRYVELVD